MNAKKMYIFTLTILIVVVIIKFTSAYTYVTYIKAPEKKYDTFDFFERKSTGVSVKRPEGDGYDLRTSNQKGGSGGSPGADTSKSSLWTNTKSLVKTTKSFTIPIALVVSIILIYFYRRNKRKKRQNTSVSFSKSVDDLQLAMHTVKPLHTEENQLIDFNSSLRKLIFTFNESLSSKLKRKEHETLSEWFNRIHFSPTNQFVYEEHRYGEVTLDKLNSDDINLLTKEMKEFLGG